VGEWLFDTTLRLVIRLGTAASAWSAANPLPEGEGLERG
jgi:hypothetical protein